MLKSSANDSHKNLLSLPQKNNLYDPEYEHDSCGLAMVATLRADPTHQVVSDALVALKNLEHRGAVGADINSGDGSGILTQIPDKLFRESVNFVLPPPGQYATGIAFIPKKSEKSQPDFRHLEKLASQENLTILGWREILVNTEGVGKTAKECMPNFQQIFLAFRGWQIEENKKTAKLLEHSIYRFRRKVQKQTDIYFPSLSTKTIVYKGMLTTVQLKSFYLDLANCNYFSKLAIVHSRFSTNTFPAWPLAQPFRMVAHNGEINTVRGNRRWMEARQNYLKNPVLGDNPNDIFPICTKGASDSMSFDEVVELLTLAGRSLPHSLMMMIPEAWENHTYMDMQRRNFYAYHSLLMEPWDGSACVSFTDGQTVGAILDRNGLRPGRYWVTGQDMVIFASEVGVVPLPKDVKIVKKGRISPGRMFAIDTVAGKILDDSTIKNEIINLNNWGQWLEQSRVKLENLPESKQVFFPKKPILLRQKMFGYTSEEIEITLTSMAMRGQEPLASMGYDVPLAVLDKRPRLLFDYFVQQFSQVTNPALDSIREELVTSLSVKLGAENNLLDMQRTTRKRIGLKSPIINNEQLAKILDLSDENGKKTVLKIKGLYEVSGAWKSLQARLTQICEEVSSAINSGISLLVFSDRDANENLAAIPSLLLTSTVHNHLLRVGQRTIVSIVVEAGDVREVHHVATLIGYGASAVNPYLAMDTVENLVLQKKLKNLTVAEATQNLITALAKGVLRVMSKMGISTMSSYRGSQTFEAIGLSREFVNEYFQGTFSALGGIGLDIVEKENSVRHRNAYLNFDKPLEIGGEYVWKEGGIEHMFNPKVVNLLQEATSKKDFKLFKTYTQLVNKQTNNLMTLRGMFAFKTAVCKPIQIDEVQNVSEIVKSFVISAMSYGSLSKEAHETLTFAMNRLGAKSNSGEGGEEVSRMLDKNLNSAVKQVASGRFGVTSLYLTSATDIEIKIAQGAKPGDGGHLMSEKMYPWIAKTRFAIPGVSLISPPSHHDIYSIEDLAQLIHDLKCANPTARIQVKLVSETGVGTVAAGVAKSKADVILVSGHDGGTAASPLNSLKHTGTPWEIGLAEIQQTLQLNKLRKRVVLQVDGQLKTGRDVVVAALLGAEEFGFATAPLVVSGCVMTRKCHLDTCPTGIATQNPTLRKNFSGRVADIITFFEFIAEEVREILASLGFRSLADAVGHSELLEVDKAIEYWKASNLNLSAIFAKQEVFGEDSLRCSVGQDHKISKHFDQKLIVASANIFATDLVNISQIAPVHMCFEVNNVDLSVGTLLGHKVTKKFSVKRLPNNTINVDLLGSAGQSLGAFLPSGITLKLYGDANDYVAKGLSGGIIAIAPGKNDAYLPHHNVIAGNVIGYGATSGEIFLNGKVGERFLVRNSGAFAVVEGIGDHGCEYMTGGVAVVLGEVGRNFGAGMSGGVAYVLDFDVQRLNQNIVLEKDFLLENLAAADEEIVLKLLYKHCEYTKSVLGFSLLKDVKKTMLRFTKILPKNYADILSFRDDALKKGKDPDGMQVWSQILDLAIEQK